MGSNWLVGVIYLPKDLIIKKSNIVDNILES
jgi:hypothetical protein